MINNYLKEVVKLPQAPTEHFDDCIGSKCKSWFFGTCDYEWGEQVAPCVNCEYTDIHDLHF